MKTSSIAAQRGRRPWSPEEDATVAEAVLQCNLDEVKVKWSTLISDRSGQGTRNRYNNYINSDNLNRTEMTMLEDQLLLQLYKMHSKKWVTISEQMPGRGPQIISNRFNSAHFQQLYASALKHLTPPKQPNPPSIPTKNYTYEPPPTTITTRSNTSSTSSTSSTSQLTEFQTSTSHFVPSDIYFGVGDIVNVQRRTGTGFNFPGGRARVTQINSDGNGDFMYNVKYILRQQAEKNLPKHLLKMYEIIQHTGSPPREKKRIRPLSVTSPGGERLTQQIQQVNRYNCNQPVFITERFPRELLEFKGCNIFLPRLIKIYSTSGTAFHEENYQVIAQTSSDMFIIRSCNEEPNLRLIAPESYSNNDGYLSEPLSLTSEARILSYCASVTGETNEEVAANVKQVNIFREEKKKRLEDAVTRRLECLNETAEEGESTPTAIGNLEGELASSLCQATQGSAKLLAVVIAQTALKNGGNVTLKHPTCNWVLQCTSLGLQESNTGTETIKDTDDDGQQPAFLFEDQRRGHVYRVKPSNVSLYVKEVHQMLVQPDRRSLGSSISLRKGTSSQNRLRKVELPDLTTDTLSKAQRGGMFNATQADRTLSMEDAVAHGGVVAVVQQLQIQKTERIKKIQNEIKTYRQKAMEQMKEEKTFVLEVEKEAVIRLAEEVFRKFIYDKDAMDQSFVIDLAENIKKIAPNLWASQAVLGHCAREGRYNNLAEKKDRKILHGLLSTLCAGNRMILGSYRIFMSLVKLVGGATFAELDRDSAIGRCASQKKTIEYLICMLPDYSTLKYPKCVDILWDNVNLNLKAKFGSGLDGTQSRVDNTTAFAIREHLTLPSLNLSVTTQRPTQTQLAEFFETKPFDPTKSPSLASVPAGHPMWHLYCTKLKTFYSRLDIPADVPETAQEHINVMITNQSMDAVMDLFRAVQSGEYGIALGLTKDEQTKLSQIKGSITECHSVSSLSYAAGSHPTKKLVRETPLSFLDSGCIDRNEMTTGGCAEIIRCLFGRIDMHMSKRDIVNAFRTNTYPNTIRASMDRGSITTVNSVLMRSCVGMKSKDPLIAEYCAQNVYIINCMTVVVDATHQNKIHGCAVIYSLRYGSGLQAMIQSTYSKSINPDRAIQKCQKHGLVLEQLFRARSFVAAVALLRSGELEKCVVKKQLDNEIFSYLDPTLFMASLDAHLEDGGPSFKHQGKSLLTDIAMYMEVLQSMRNYDYSGQKSYSLHALGHHRILGKKYFGGSMDEIGNFHFLSEHMKHVIINETYVAIKGSSSAGVDLGDRIESRVKFAKQRKGADKQNLWLSSIQRAQLAFSAMNDDVNVDAKPPRKKHQSPVQHRQVARLCEHFNRSGVAEAGNQESVADGVERMYSVTEAFVKEDEELKEQKKLEKEENDNLLMEVEGDDTDTNNNTTGLEGNATKAQQRIMGLKLTSMGGGTHDTIWDTAPKKPKPPPARAKLVKKYLNHHAKWKEPKAQTDAINKQLKKLQLKNFVMNDAINCYLSNHCNGAVPSTVASKIEINISILDQLTEEDFSKEDNEWCKNIEEELVANQEEEDLWEDTEWVPN